MQTKSYIYFTAVLLSTMIFALAGCGGTTTSQNGQGAISAKLVWNSTKTTGKSVASAPTGVSTVRLAISGTGITTIQQDFPAANGTGTLNSVPVGSGLTVTASGLDSSGTIIYQGSVGSVTVQDGTTTDVGTITMAVVTSTPTSTSIIGTWGVYGDPTVDTKIMTFVDSTHYMLVSAGPTDSYGSTGLEYGTYTYDPATGTGGFGSTSLFDTNGEWGVSNPPAGSLYSFSISGDTLTVGNPVEGNLQFPRLKSSATNPVVGSWWAPFTDAATGKAGGVLIAFLDDTHFLLEQAGNDSVDTTGTGYSGIELGTYTINSSHVLSTSLVVDTNGDWGSSNPPVGSYSVSVSGNTLTISSTEGVGSFVRLQ